MVTFQSIDILDTIENKKGLIAYSADPLVNIISFPDKADGYVKLKSYDKNYNVLIHAHDSEICCLELSYNGTYLATASKRGNIIRIFRADDGNFLHKFRRGSDTTNIYYLTFDLKNNYLACTCSNGVVHLFSMKAASDKNSSFPVVKER